LADAGPDARQRQVAHGQRVFEFMRQHGGELALSLQAFAL
jgi:hypothetical protein